MKTILMNYLRANEWLSSKVTMMLGVAAYFICLDKTDFRTACPELVAYFLFLAMFLSFSYVFNDYVDIEIDRKAGKKKLIADMPKSLVFASFIIMGVIGIAPVILISENKVLCAVLVAATYFLGAAYSMPGIRFKERGLIGLLECSFAQRCMPLAILLLFIKPERQYVLLWTGWLILSFADGLRYILIHQYLDRENDKKTDTHTFVSDKQFGIRRSLAVILAVVVLLTLIQLIPLIPDYYYIVLPCILLTLAAEFCIYQVLNVFAQKDWLVTFDSVPMEGFFNIIMPIMFGLCMMRNDIRAILFIIFSLLCCYKSLRIKAGIAMIYVKSKIS